MQHESRLIFPLPSSGDDILFLTLTGISSDAGIKEELVGTSASLLRDVSADKENEKLLPSPNHPISTHKAILSQMTLIC